MRTFRKEAGDGQSYSHCRWAGESYAHRRWAGPNPLNGRQTFPPFASLLSVFNCMKLQEDDTHLHSPEIAEVDSVLASPNDSATSATTSHMCTTAYASVPPSHERKCPFLSRLNWRWHRSYAGRRSSHQSGRRHNTHAHAFSPLHTRTSTPVHVRKVLTTAPMRLRCIAFPLHIHMPAH